MKARRKGQVASRRTIDRLRTLAAGMALAGAIAACGDSGPSAPPGPKIYTTPAGTYNASSINAQPLPFKVFAADNFTYEVMSGTMSLTSDGKFSVKQTFRQTIAGKVDVFVDSTGGTWSLSGTTVNFVNGQDGSTDKADWANIGTLTFTEIDGPSTNTYVYTIKP